MAHVKVRLFRIMLIALFFMLILPFTLKSTSKQENELPFETNSTLYPQASLTHDFGGYQEEDFVPIYISSEDIQFDNVKVSIYQSYLKCNVSFTYPSTGNLWKIILPETFSDAQKYYIKRSALEFYYTTDDEASSVASYVGSTSYWILSGSASITDTIDFQVLVPTIDFKRDYERESLDKRVYFITISRFEDVNRPYNNVVFEHEFQKRWENFKFEFFNTTGGQDLNFTDHAEFDYRIDSRTSGEIVVFNLNLGYIQNRTDYSFEMAVIKLPTPPTFFSDIFGNLIVPLLVGFFPAILVHPYIIRKLSFLNKETYQGKTWGDVIKYGFPIGLIAGVIGILVSYLLWFYNIT